MGRVHAAHESRDWSWPSFVPASGTAGQRQRESMVDHDRMPDRIHQRSAIWWGGMPSPAWTSASTTRHIQALASRCWLSPVHVTSASIRWQRRWLVHQNAHHLAVLLFYLHYDVAERQHCDHIDEFFFDRATRVNRMLQFGATL
jgi:hypothetical protein